MVVVAVVVMVVVVGKPAEKISEDATVAHQITPVNAPITASLRRAALAAPCCHCHRRRGNDKKGTKAERRKKCHLAVYSRTAGWELKSEIGYPPPKGR